MTETWKDILNYEGLYQVSDLGSVKSLNRVTRHSHNLKERILKCRLDSKGYFYVSLCKDAVVHNFRVHRLVAIAFIVNPNNKSCINHKDGVKINNEPYNLEWCTYKENTRHKDRVLGKHVFGEKNGEAKLTEVDVIYIRDSNLLQRELAEIFKVSRSQISRIKNKKSWKHLKEV
jgi:hypothetical protein